jgi:hypothetical protein
MVCRHHNCNNFVGRDHSDESLRCRCRKSVPPAAEEFRTVSHLHGVHHFLEVVRDLIGYVRMHPEAGKRSRGVRQL